MILRHTHCWTTISALSFTGSGAVT